MPQKLRHPFDPGDQPGWNFRGPHPHDYTTQRYKGLAKHEGEDEGLALQSRLYASGHGKVVDEQIGYVGQPASGGGWGTHLVISYFDVELPDGRVFDVIDVRTAHMTVTFVHVGDTVTPGMIIGNTGNTGASSGPHLHEETRTGFVRWGNRGTLFDPREIFWWPTPTDNPTNSGEPGNEGGALVLDKETSEQIKTLVTEVLGKTVSAWEWDTRAYMGRTIIEHEGAIYFMGEGENGRPVAYHVPDEGMFWMLCRNRFLSGGPVYVPGQNPIATPETNAAELEAFARLHKVEFDLRG